MLSAIHLCLLFFHIWRKDNVENALCQADLAFLLKVCRVILSLLLSHELVWIVNTKKADKIACPLFSIYAKGLFNPFAYIIVTVVLTSCCIC